MTRSTFAKAALTACLLWALGPGTAAAQDPAPDGTTPYDKVPSAAESRTAYLDTLFEDLSAATSADQAAILENMIWKVWTESGSPSVDLLMGRGVEALGDGELDRALTYFEQVVILAPNYAEGWNKRATVHYMKDEYGRSIGDIEQTLRLEPRHFGALGGLALILVELDDKEGALEAYRRVLKIHPWLDGAKEAEAALTVEVEGRGI